MILRRTTASLLLVLAARTAGHNWLLTPIPRIPGGLYGSGISEADNCESDSTDVPSDNQYQRGDQIKATWVYNNHWGGFARFSIVPLGQEGDLDAVNDPSNFLKISCHTGTCGGRGQDLNDDEHAYFSPYNLPAQNVQFDNSNPKLACGTTITVPTYLKDGTYVLQWIMYGTHDSNGNKDMALPFYRNCANIKVQGGSDATNKPDGSCNFAWQGGDKSLQDPNNLDTTQCSYWKFNSINSTLSSKYYDGGGELYTKDYSTQVDATALRHGPAAEVIACAGKTDPSSSSGVSPTKAKNNATSQSQPDTSPTDTSLSDTSPTPTLSNQKCQHGGFFLKVQSRLRKRWAIPRVRRRLRREPR